MYATSLNRSSSGYWSGGSIDAKIGTRFSVTMDLTRLFLNLLEQRWIQLLWTDYRLVNGASAQIFHQFAGMKWPSAIS
jgi:hypothetical protein